MKGSRGEPVYIITGLKIARGPAFSSKHIKKREFKNELTVSEPGGVPIDVGFKINPSSDQTNTMEVKKSDDFIFGIRVKRLTYQKHWRNWLSSKPAELVAEHHYKGAMLVDADDIWEKQNDDILELELDDEDMAGMVEEREIDGEGNETCWIIRQS